MTASMFLRVYAHEGKRLSRSFESFVATLNDWQGMFIEMDGSFVWAFVCEERRYQVDGMVYDRDGAIEYLELKGNLIPEMWKQLLKALSDDADEPSEWDPAFRIHDVTHQCWTTPTAILQTISTQSLRPRGEGNAP